MMPYEVFQYFIAFLLVGGPAVLAMIVSDVYDEIDNF